MDCTENVKDLVVLNTKFKISGNLVNDYTELSLKHLVIM